LKKWLQNGIKNILSVKINITIKSRDKVKCETNMSQLRINKKNGTVANKVKVSYFNTPNYSSW